MKKIVFLSLSLMALLACNKEVITGPVQEVGYLSFALEADDIVVTTKATVTELDAYNVYIGNTSYNYGSEIKGKVLERTPGTYTIYAENMTPSAAEEGKGSLRLASESKTVTVTAGGTTVETLHCTAVNAKISVTFSDSFKNAFSTWDLTLGYESDDTRDLTIDETASASDAVFFYNINGKNLTLELSAIARQDSSTKTHTEKITLAAGYHYTVNYTAGANGYLGITVTADDALVDAEDTDVTVNPYN